MMDSYESACGAINPRLEREIQERERRIQELLRRAAGIPDENFDITVETKDRASSNLGPVVNTENLVVPNTPTETRPLNNDEAVTLEIRGDRLIEKGESQKYQDANQYHQVPVTLSSIKLRKPQNITLELRSAGPLIGKQNSMLTHSIDVQKTKTHYSTVTQTQEEVVLQNGGNYHGTSGNQKEVMLIINDHGDSIEPVQARFVEADEELLNLRRKHLPTTSL